MVNISTVSWGMTRLLPDSWDLKYAQSTDSLEMGWIVYWYIVEQSPKISWKLTEIPTTPCRPSYTVSIPSNSDWIVVQNVRVKDDSLCFALLWKDWVLSKICYVFWKKWFSFIEGNYVTQLRLMYHVLYCFTTLSKTATYEEYVW